MAGGLSGATRTYFANMPQVVPADYVGMHFRGWPTYDQTYWQSTSHFFPKSAPPAPTGLTYKSVRFWDAGKTLWAHIETSAGVYNWTLLDSLVSTHRAAGRTVIYPVYGTPLFYVSNGTDRGRTDDYALQGGGAYPDQTAPNGITALTNFVTALINRYNKAGGAWFDANNATMGKGIQVVEPWNEPFFTGYPGFWWGTAGQFVDVAWTVYSAVKAADATVTVGSPGCATASTLQTFLTTAGTINTTKTGKDCCEVLGVHQYNCNLPGTGLGAWSYDVLSSSIVGLQGWAAAAAAGNASAYPIWMTEGGFDYNDTSAELTIAGAQPASWRRTLWARMMMLGAACGFKKWLSYCWDAPYLSTMMNDPSGAPAALNLIAGSVSGKTITSAYYVPGGEVSLSFSDGSSLTV